MLNVIMCRLLLQMYSLLMSWVILLLLVINGGMTMRRVMSLKRTFIIVGDPELKKVLRIRGWLYLDLLLGARMVMFYFPVLLRQLHILLAVLPERKGKIKIKSNDVRFILEL